MDLHQHPNGDCVRAQESQPVCAWCGRMFPKIPNARALPSHGICNRCAWVLEGQTMSDKGHPSGDPVVSEIEEHTNRLMCRLYESRQALLAIQRRVGDDAELLGIVGHALTSIRQQERVVADIQQCILSAEDLNLLSPALDSVVKTASANESTA